MADISSGRPTPKDLAPGSVIDNEIPAYRAINSTAIFSMILGVVSLLCFTDLMFLIVAVAAVLVGVLAIRQINKRSDVLTGTGFARVGIVLGIVFGIAATTSTMVQWMVLRGEVNRFCASFVDVLKKEPVAVAVWYHQPPSVRNTRKPDELVEELKKSSGGNPAGDTYTQQTTPILRIKDALADKGSDIHFDEIELLTTRGLTAYANALFEVHRPAAKEAAEKEAFARVRIRKDNGNQRDEWTVEEIEFPYKRASYVEKAEPVDDGHGHGH